MPDWKGDRASAARVVLVVLGAGGRVMSRRAICVLRVEDRADGCPPLSVGVTGEISASDRRSGDGGLQQGCDGHELSSPIDGMGHCRGWQPGSKVSMVIIRPPQQGQAFHAQRRRVGYAEQPAGQCDITGPVS
jgi:hypothetical protein